MVLRTCIIQYKYVRSTRTIKCYELRSMVNVKFRTRVRVPGTSTRVPSTWYSYYFGVLYSGTLARVPLALSLLSVNVQVLVLVQVQLHEQHVRSTCTTYLFCSVVVLEYCNIYTVVLRAFKNNNMVLVLVQYNGMATCQYGSSRTCIEYIDGLLCIIVGDVQLTKGYLMVLPAVS
jgi:hypothetical protein